MTRTRQLRQDLAILPMGVVSQLTGLSARQIRYYDQQNLINPERGSGQQRRYSLNQIERLMEIADYLDAGYSIADIHAVDQKKQKKLIILIKMQFVVHCKLNLFKLVVLEPVKERTYHDKTYVFKAGN